MALLTPSTDSTSSSRIAAWSVAAAPGAADVCGAGGEGHIDGADGGVDADRFGAIQVEEDAVDDSGGIPLVVKNRVTSAMALTCSIRNRYRHRAARLERFLTEPRRDGTE